MLHARRRSASPSPQIEQVCRARFAVASTPTRATRNDDLMSLAKRRQPIQQLPRGAAALDCTAKDVPCCLGCERPQAGNASRRAQPPGSATPNIGGRRPESGFLGRNDVRSVHVTCVSQEGDSSVRSSNRYKARYRAEASVGAQDAEKPTATSGRPEAKPTTGTGAQTVGQLDTLYAAPLMCSTRHARPLTYRVKLGRPQRGVRARSHSSTASSRRRRHAAARTSDRTTDDRDRTSAAHLALSSLLKAAADRTRKSQPKSQSEPALFQRLLSTRPPAPAFCWRVGRHTPEDRSDSCESFWCPGA